MEILPENILTDRSIFKRREPGLTHPDNSSFVRLADNGDIEIVAKPGLAIILHPQSNSMTFVADNIKFLTNEQHGLRWNKLSFNPQGYRFPEPALLPYEDGDTQTIYNGTEEYM